MKSRCQFQINQGSRHFAWSLDLYLYAMALAEAGRKSVI